MNRRLSITKMRNVNEVVCERDFVYYVMELLYPGKRNKEDKDVWAGYERDGFFLTNILNIILLNQLTHIVNYNIEYLLEQNRISLNIDKIKNILVRIYEDHHNLDINDLTLQELNHTCQFFECDGATKYSNNSTIINYDWRMFFKVLNMLSVNDYDVEQNNSHFKFFSEYDTTPNPLPTYRVWENLEIGPYIITYDSESNPSSLYSFSPYFKKQKINDPTSIVATGQVKYFDFSYNVNCTPQNIKRLIDLNYDKVDYFITEEFKSLITFFRTNSNNDEDFIYVDLLDYIKLLLDKLEDINETDYKGRTILIYAVMFNNTEYVIYEILKKNPDLSIKDVYGKTALDYAIESKNNKLIRLLKNYNPANVKPVNVKPPLLKPISPLISNSKDKQQVSIEYEALKHAIIYNKGINRVESLLDDLEDINETDSKGKTILIQTVSLPFSENIEYVKAILKKNPDVSIKDVYGKTALDYAIELKKNNVIILLNDVKPVIIKPINLNAESINSIMPPQSPNFFEENVKPKSRHQKCDIVDTLTVADLNKVFNEINEPVPAAKISKEKRINILKHLLGC